MYVNLMVATNCANAWRADLRDYARWEYGRNAEAWLLATARRGPERRKASGLGRRLRAWLHARKDLPTPPAATPEARGP